MASEPKSYTDIGGGGKNPPHGEDYFDRIVNVHWPEKGPAPATGGVFITADLDSTVYYMDVSKVLDDVKLIPQWQNLGTLDFGGFSTGFIQGSAHALVGPKQQSAFVLVGGGGSTGSVGLIMASRDGLHWSRAFTFGIDSPTFLGANIFGVVWDGKAFWAGGHQSDQSGVTGDTGTIMWMSETDILFSSTDGFNWHEVSRHETRIETTVGGPPFPPWPEYTTGLLEPHCSSVIEDFNGNGVPGGVYGYIEDTDILLAPITPPTIEYLFGGIGFNPDGVRNVGASIPFSADPGIPANAVAVTGGIWAAAGGTFIDSFSNFSAAAVLLASPGAPGGVAWKIIDPGGKMLVTLCGGPVAAP